MTPVHVVTTRKDTKPLLKTVPKQPQTKFQINIELNPMNFVKLVKELGGKTTAVEALTQEMTDETVRASLDLLLLRTISYSHIQLMLVKSIEIFWQRS